MTHYVPLLEFNAHLDSDGVIRRAAAGETLGDGSLLQSLPLSVLRTLQPEDWKARVAALDPAAPAPAALIAWRQGEQPYPHVAFADVFQQAEGQAPSQAVPPFAGRIVVIGATAPTLHDSHPTAVSPRQSGVDTLATLIDNELHRRHVAELPGWAQTLLAIALCATIAWLVRYRSLTLLDRTMLALPALLLGISYASLQTDAVFLDLYLATGWALLLMGLLARWVKWRRAHWCSMPPPAPRGEPLALWPLYRQRGWSEMAVHRLIHLLERYGPACRILLPGTPGSAGEWPEFARLAALVGPADAVQAARRELAAFVACPAAPLAETAGPCQLLPDSSGRAALVAAALQAWQTLDADTRSDHERRNPEWTVAGH